MGPKLLLGYALLFGTENECTLLHYTCVFVAANLNEDGNSLACSRTHNMETSSVQSFYQRHEQIASLFTAEILQLYAVDSA